MKLPNCWTSVARQRCGGMAHETFETVAIPKWCYEPNGWPIWMGIWLIYRIGFFGQIHCGTVEKWCLINQISVFVFMSLVCLWIHRIHFKRIKIEQDHTGTKGLNHSKSNFSRSSLKFFPVLSFFFMSQGKPEELNEILASIENSGNAAAWRIRAPEAPGSAVRAEGLWQTLALSDHYQSQTVDVEYFFGE